MIKRHFSDAEALVGVATAGIAHAALVADYMELPMAYARAVAKEHGTKSLIEGKLEEGTKVVIIEDLISTGKSSLEVVKGVRMSAMNVIGLAAIFSYDFPVASEAAHKENVAFVTLTDYNVLLDIALEMDYIRENDAALLKSWRESPHTWGK